MSCGSEDCGCGCNDLVQLKIPSKKVDALKRTEILSEDQEQEPAPSSEARAFFLGLLNEKP